MYSSLADCKHCPLREYPDVPPEGNPRAEICVLAEGPGMWEESRGRPLIGPSGRVFEEILEHAGIRRDDLWISNSALSMPRPVMVDPNEGISITQGQARDQSIRCCAPRLYAELKQVHPKVIVCLGAKAYKQVTGLDGIAKYHGSVVRVRLGSLGEDGVDDPKEPLTYVVPLYHPAFLLRGKNQYYVSLIDGFKKAKRLAYGKEMEPCQFHYITPLMGELDQALADFEDLVEDVLRTNEPFAVDVETTGKNPRAATLTILGFGFYERRLGVSIAVLYQDQRTKEYKQLWPPKAWARLNQAIARLLASRNLKVPHNFGYDLTVLERYYTVRGRLADTIILHHLYQPDLPHDLGWVVMNLATIDVEPWKAFFRDAWRKGKTTFQEELEYNCRDALYTGLAVEPLTREVGLRSNLHLVAHQLRTAELARSANKWGIPIDLPTWYAMREKHAAGRDEALAALRAKILEQDGAVESLNDFLRRKAKGKLPRPVTIDEFNPLSPNHARWFLYDHLGLEPLRFTKGGAEGTKSDTSYSAKGVVEYISQPAVKEFVRFAEERAYVSTLDSLFGHCDPVEGDLLLREVLERARVDDVVPVTRDILTAIQAAIARSPGYLIVRLHPSWNTTGQKGTRWGSRPNSQNWEKDLRKMCKQPPGRKWVGADASSLEYRIAACLAGIQELLDLFNQEPFDEDTEPWKKFDPAFDAHSLVAAEVYREDFTLAVQRAVEDAWETEVRDPLGAAQSVPSNVPRANVKLWKFFAALGIGCEAVARGRKEQSRLRTFVKRVVYAMFYGATVDKIFDTLMEDKKLSREIRAKITREWVAEIVEGFNRRFKEWNAWVDRETVKVKVTDGYQVIPPFGRRRWYPMAYKVEVTKIRNGPIQISAGDIVNKMFCAMDDAIRAEGLDAHFCIHGHDACYWDTADEDVQRTIEIVNEHFDGWLTSTSGHKVRIYGRAHAAQDLAAAA